MILKKTSVFSILTAAIVFFITADVSAKPQPAYDRIPNSIVSVSSGYVIAVDKKYQKLFVFKKSGAFYKVFEATCSTGKNQGSKEITGDAKTPNGIFFATKIVNNPGPPETYGTLAFTLDYPTVLDKMAGRNGNNIWIHGTTKPLTPFQSNGCVVLADKDVQALSKFIHINKTPVIIDETINWVPQNQTNPVKTELENLLWAWHDGYSNGNMQAIDALYLQGHQIKNKKREQMAASLASMKNIKPHFSLAPRDISILHQNDHSVIVFDRITGVNKDNSFEGSFNKLVLQKIKNRWFMIDDVEAPVVLTAKLAPPPALSPAPAEEGISKEPVQRLIRKWSESWASGNTAAYRSCYTSNFRAQGMNLNDWIQNKQTIRERSRNISIRLSNIKISGNNNEAQATFTQHYKSSLLKRDGNKKLELRKVNGEWKIYREIMQ